MAYDFGSEGVRDWLCWVVHEPLFQFILLGFLIWAAVEYLGDRNNRYTIHIGQAEQKRVAANYFQQFGRLPTPAELQALIGEEIFLREGLAIL